MLKSICPVCGEVLEYNCICEYYMCENCGFIYECQGLKMKVYKCLNEVKLKPRKASK